jgi:UrcA family protein
MKTFLLCSALAALALPAAAEARAANSDAELPKVVVSYADLDLNRPAGADVMIARVRRAAQSVCSDDLFAGHTQVRQIRKCVRSAMSGAFAQLDAPLVTSRYLHPAPNAEFAGR